MTVMKARRPEPRIGGWIHPREFKGSLKAHGSATVYSSEEFARKVAPELKPVRITMVVHVPRTKPKRKKQPLNAGAIAARDLARRKREATDVG